MGYHPQNARFSAFLPKTAVFQDFSGKSS